MQRSFTDVSAKSLRVSIARSAAQAYEFLSVPENFPKWASGLGTSVRQAGADWIADTAEGPATVCLTERNSHGVLDHSVTRPKRTDAVRASSRRRERRRL